MLLQRSLIRLNRSDGPLGNGWEGDTNNFTLSNGTLVNASGNGLIRWPTPAGPDQEVYTTVMGSDPTASSLGLVLKAADRGDGWNHLEACYSFQTQEITIWTVHNWGTWIQHGDPLALTLQPGDQVGMRATAAGLVTIYHNGTAVGSVQVSAAWPYRDSSGQPGLDAWYAPNLRLDSFGGGTLP